MWFRLGAAGKQPDQRGVNGQKEETDRVAQNAEQAAASTALADSRVNAGNEVVRQTLQRIEQLVTAARQTQHALSGIADALAVIHGMDQQIAAAAEQQTAVAENIGRSVTSIRDLGEQWAAVMKQNAASSQQLADLGREMHAMAGHFRL